MKKILYGLVALAVLVGAILMLLNRSRSLSPAGTAQLTHGDLSISITFGRPSVRNRIIFGTEEQGALQPYGVYWRLGANEATEITFNKNVTFNGNPVKAGTYRMYAIPGPGEFELILNSELGIWGVFEPDPALDVLKTKAPVQHPATPTEIFTINLLPAEGGIDISFEWADVKILVPVKG